MLLRELNLWVQLFLTHMPEGSWIATKIRKYFWKRKLRVIGYGLFVTKGAKAGRFRVVTTIFGSVPGTTPRCLSIPSLTAYLVYLFPSLLEFENRIQILDLLKSRKIKKVP